MNTTWSWNKDTVLRRIERLEEERRQASTSRRKYEIGTIIDRWQRRLIDIMERENVDRTSS